MNMSQYEQEALARIHQWKEPSDTAFDKFFSQINEGVEKATDKLPEFPRVVKDSVNGLFTLINDGSHKTVRPSVIYEEFRANGHSHIQQPADIFTLDLEHVDNVVGFLGAKYKAIAGGEGAGCGCVSVFGIPADIVSLTAINLRAIGEYATYYGFNIKSQEERLFALNVLQLASSPTLTSKQLAMAQLIKISQDLVKKKTWKELEKEVLVIIIQKITKSLGIRLTKAKLADIIPALGVFIGASYNIYYTNNVCNSAFNLYRERFLAKKYGRPDLIKICVPPASSLLTTYGDEDIN